MTNKRKPPETKTDDVYKQTLAGCISYFREREVYRTLFIKVREKYASLGHFGGSVRMSGLSREQLGQLGGFFQKDYIGQKTVTISFAAMEKALENSRFSCLAWEDILREYFGEELWVNKEQKLAEREEQNRFFAGIMEEFPKDPGRDWLEETLRCKGNGYLLLVKQYKEAPKELAQTLRQFLKAVPLLPFIRGQQIKETAGDGVQRTPRELLAVYAARSTTDPHFFDEGTLGEQLLTAFLRAKMQTVSGEGTFRMEKKAQLYYEAGLLKDDLSNHTLVYGIHAIKKDGTKHEGIEGFLHCMEPVHLTLMTLGGLSAVTAQGSGCVYVVENPAVFSALIRNWPDAAVICGNGQIRLATLALMDLFDTDTIFYYAGDFDPEGLQIAQKLAARYQGRLKLWNYRPEYYERYKSTVKLSPKSLKKLDNIDLKELLEIKAAIKRDGQAAYQETMLREYLLGRMDEKAK